MTEDTLQTKFYSDPDFQAIVDRIKKHLEPLMDMTTIDTTQPAETVKAEVIARSLAYNTLADIVNDSGITKGNEVKKVENPYR